MRLMGGHRVGFIERTSAWSGDARSGTRRWRNSSPNGRVSLYLRVQELTRDVREPDGVPEEKRIGAWMEAMGPETLDAFIKLFEALDA